MTATTPGTASNSESRKRLAEQNTPARAKHHDPAVVQLIEQARAEGAAEAWDEAIQAVAWCLDNGEPSAAAALAYSHENNPHRAALRGPR